MYDLTRGLIVLCATAAAGALIWLASQPDALTAGGYWKTIGLLSGAGLVFGLPRLLGLRGERTRLAVGTFLLSFLPAFVAAGWVVTAATPRSAAGRHVLRWSGDIGIGRLVSDLTTFAGLLAFATGVLLLYCFAHRRLVVEEAPLVAEAPVETDLAGPPAAVEEPVPAAEPAVEPLAAAPVAAAPVVTDEEVVAAPAVEPTAPVADDVPVERIDRERPLEPVAPRQAAGNGPNGNINDGINEGGNGSLTRDALAQPREASDGGSHSAVDGESMAPSEDEAVSRR